MTMRWQDEVLKTQRKREWLYFYVGCLFAAAVIGLVVLFVIKATGGIDGGCP